MSKYLAIVFIVAIFGLIMTYQNCAPAGSINHISDNYPNSVNEAVNFTGTVKTLDLEDCGKVIISDSDKTSTFLVKPELLKSIPEHSKVAIRGTIADGAVSTCMVGTILNVDNIQVVQ